MNKRIIFFIIIILIIVISILIYDPKHRNNYSKYLLIKTEKYYYKLNIYGYSKKVDNIEFTEDSNKNYLITDCFESYIDRDKNEVLNKINNENYNKFIENNDDSNLINIINEIAKLKHEMIYVKIINTQSNNYYVVTYLNTNWICPSDLYLYNKQTQELQLIFEKCNECILDVNEKV